MKGKLGAALFCLAFAIPFGAVGAGATWALVTMIYDGMRAKDWVLVKADVIGPSSYRYTFNGETHTNDRLGTFRLGGTSDVDDFDERVASILAQGREEKRPITVFVNPDNPSESMVDRAIRWGFLIFLLPFALGFGGVGVGALWFLGKTLTGSDAPKKGRQQPSAAKANAASGIAGLWIFAFFWNVISFPIAILVVPQIIASGEWVGLLVLIFPIIGVLVLWGAIAATVARLRRGQAQFSIQTPKPRVGAPVEGSVEFNRGVKPGEAFRVRLECERTSRAGEETSVSRRWTKEIQAKAVSSPAGVRIPFRFDVPTGLPATDSDDDKPVTHRWLIEVQPAKGNVMTPYRKEVEMLPALFDGTSEAAPPEPDRAVVLDATLKQLLGGTFDPATLTPEQKASFAQLSSNEQAIIAKVGQLTRFAPSGKKIIIGIVCLVVAMEVVPFILTLVR